MARQAKMNYSQKDDEMGTKTEREGGGFEAGFLDRIESNN
jgi:hypothetical protein